MFCLAQLHEIVEHCLASFRLAAEPAPCIPAKDYGEHINRDHYSGHTVERGLWCRSPLSHLHQYVAKHDVVSRGEKYEPLDDKLNVGPYKLAPLLELVCQNLYRPFIVSSFHNAWNTGPVAHLSGPRSISRKGGPGTAGRPKLSTGGINRNESGRAPQFRAFWAGGPHML